MAALIFSLSFYLGVVLISCFAPSSLSRTFTAENPIRLASNGLRDDISYAHLISPPVEAIYQFGDSIADTGNCLRDDPSYVCGQFPYGESYLDQPTGRCSDGLLMIDYFAQFLELPFLEPYLNREGNFTHGVNFAVGGSTSLDSPTLATKYNLSAATDLSLAVQLGWFKSHLGSICSNASECKRKLSKALFLMGEIGGNDYNDALTEGKSLVDVYPMVPEVVNTIKKAAEEIIVLGATRVAIPGNFPVGCMALYLVQFKTNDSSMYDELGCLNNLNEFAELHNNQIKQAIQKLQNDHPNVAIFYLDYYETYREILRHPTSYGFDKNSRHKACCGLGDNEYNSDLQQVCGTDDVAVCQNPQEYVSWDGCHSTQHTYFVMAEWLIKDIVYGLSKRKNRSSVF